MPHLLQNKRQRNKHVVVTLDTPRGRPIDCRRCGKRHTKKTVHARTDSEGRITVSEGVYEAWLASGLGAWKLLGIVDEPLQRGAVTRA